MNLGTRHFFCFPVYAQQVGQRTEKCRAAARILHLDASTQMARLLHKGEILQTVRLKDMHVIAFDEAEPCTIIISHGVSSHEGLGVMGVAAVKDLVEKRLLLDFATPEENMVFRVACAAIAAGNLDHYQFNSQVVYEGHVSKKGLPSWKSRYAILVAGRLILSTSPTAPYPRDVVSLGSSAVLPRPNVKAHTVCLECEDEREIVLRCGTKRGEFLHWMSMLTRAAASSPLPSLIKAKSMHLDPGYPPLPISSSFRHPSLAEPLMEPPSVTPLPLPQSPKLSYAAAAALSAPPAMHPLASPVHLYSHTRSESAKHAEYGDALSFTQMVGNRRLWCAMSADAGAHGAVYKARPSSMQGMLYAGDDDGGSSTTGSFLGSMQGHVGGWGGANHTPTTGGKGGWWCLDKHARNMHSNPSAAPHSSSHASSRRCSSGDGRQGGGVCAYPHIKQTGDRQHDASKHYSHGLMPDKISASPSNGCNSSLQKEDAGQDSYGSAQSIRSLESMGEEAARKAVLDELMGAQSVLLEIQTQLQGLLQREGRSLLSSLSTPSSSSLPQASSNAAASNLSGQQTPTRHKTSTTFTHAANSPHPTDITHATGTTGRILVDESHCLQPNCTIQTSRAVVANAAPANKRLLQAALTGDVLGAHRVSQWMLKRTMRLCSQAPQKLRQPLSPPANAAHTAEEFVQALASAPAHDALSMAAPPPASAITCDDPKPESPPPGPPCLQPNVLIPALVPLGQGVAFSPPYHQHGNGLGLQVPAPLTQKQVYQQRHAPSTSRSAHRPSSFHRSAAAISSASCSHKSDAGQSPLLCVDRVMSAQMQWLKSRGVTQAELSLFLAQAQTQAASAAAAAVTELGRSQERSSKQHSGSNEGCSLQPDEGLASSQQQQQQHDQQHQQSQEGHAAPQQTGPLTQHQQPVQQYLQHADQQESRTCALGPATYAPSATTGDVIEFQPDMSHILPGLSLTVRMLKTQLPLNSSIPPQLQPRILAATQQQHAKLCSTAEATLQKQQVQTQEWNHMHQPSQQPGAISSNHLRVRLQPDQPPWEDPATAINNPLFVSNEDSGNGSYVKEVSGAWNVPEPRKKVQELCSKANEAKDPNPASCIGSDKQGRGVGSGHVGGQLQEWCSPHDSSKGVASSCCQKAMQVAISLPEALKQHSLVQAFECTEPANFTDSHKNGKEGQDAMCAASRQNDTKEESNSTQGATSRSSSYSSCRRLQGGERDLDSAIIGEGRAPAKPALTVAGNKAFQHPDHKATSCSVAALERTTHSSRPSGKTASMSTPVQGSGQQQHQPPGPKTPARSQPAAPNHYQQLLQMQSKVPSHQRQHHSKPAAVSNLSVPASLAVHKPAQPSGSKTPTHSQSATSSSYQQEEQQQSWQQQQKQQACEYDECSKSSTGTDSITTGHTRSNDRINTNAGSHEKQPSLQASSDPASSDIPQHCQQKKLAASIQTKPASSQAATTFSHLHSTPSTKSIRHTVPHKSNVHPLQDASSLKPRAHTHRSKGVINASGRSSTPEKSSSKAGLEYPRLARTTLDLQALLRQLNEGKLTPAEFLAKLSVMNE